MIEVERVTAPNDEARALVGELDAELGAEYPPEQRHGLSLDAIFRPHVRFFVARADGGAVGCGGLALMDGFGELKRMYVRPHARGSGAAEAILRRLEELARAESITILRLETGTRQHAAIRFYERCGYQPCEAFGAYAKMPPSSVATSVFFEKRLT
jgi:putative acetyltransferase